MYQSETSIKCTSELLSEEKLGSLLVMPDLPESHSARTIPMRLLLLILILLIQRTLNIISRLVSKLSLQLLPSKRLAGSLATSALARSVLVPCHLNGGVESVATVYLLFRILN